MTISFFLILKAREYLQVGLNVQSAHDLAAQRHDVIDFVPYAGHTRQSRRFAIHSLDRLVVSPGWRGPSFCGIALSYECVDLAWIALGPLAIALFRMLEIHHSPAPAVVLSMLLITLVPLSERIRVRAIPLVALFIYARPTPKRQSIVRRTIHVKARERLRVQAHTTTLQTGGFQRCILGAARDQCRISARFTKARDSAGASVRPFSPRLSCAEITERLVKAALRTYLRVRRQFHVLMSIPLGFERRCFSAF